MSRNTRTKGTGQLYCAYVVMHIELAEICEILIYIYIYIYIYVCFVRQYYWDC
jgi:hypothetical protein